MSSESPGGQSISIRMLTLNARQGFHASSRSEALRGIRDALRVAGADLVFLQEVGVAGGTSVPVAQYEYLADGIWPQYAYGRNAIATGGHHGNALLSKFPIESWQNVDISLGSSERRGMLHCVLGVPGASRPLHAVCLHLALRESHRRRQVQQLLELAEHEVPEGVPLVVAGDFNDWRGLAHRRLSGERGFEEVHAAAKGRPARSFPARSPLLRLDRIYVRGLRHSPLDLDRRPWARLSDHVPVGAVVELP